MARADFETLALSLQRMIDALDQARTTSSDLPDAAPPTLGQRIMTGRPGRPRIHVDPTVLEGLNTGRTTRPQVAAHFHCGTRTIRRRLIEHGLSQPGPPVYDQQDNGDGTITRSYHPGVSSDLAHLTDPELDELMLQIHTQFPSFGRRMIDGYLLQMGQRVPRSRILASYTRVLGPSNQLFAPRRLHRRVYSVPGPNSLWHHDGQHGTFSSELSLSIQQTYYFLQVLCTGR